MFLKRVLTLALVATLLVACASAFPAEIALEAVQVQPDLEAAETAQFGGGYGGYGGHRGGFGGGHYGRGGGYGGFGGYGGHRGGYGGGFGGHRGGHFG